MINKCSVLHEWFNSLEKYRFPFDETKIPFNGIYILFEKGERAHGTDRIVRIGTHTGNDQLRSRLKQHFLNENKDRSIFRKNIGRCLLNKDKDPFLEQWELDLTPTDSKKKHLGLIDFGQQEMIEKGVSNYMQGNFTFATFRVDDKRKRLEFETKIVSTLSLCVGCKPSKKWLGLFSTKQKIQEAGLWQVNGLYKEPLSDKDMKDLKIYLGMGSI